MAIVHKKTEGQPRELEPLRALLSWDPFHELHWDPFVEMSPLSRVSFTPLFDVKETADGYLFRADLPGVEEKDLEISLVGNRLTVSGKRESGEHIEGERFYVSERSYGSFTRTFTLPEGIDSEHVQAELRNGILSVQLTKRPELQPKKIRISGGKAAPSA
jgi:HSP20 family protein